MIDYDAHDWRSHLLDIRGSMLREILWRVALVVAWSAVVTYDYQNGVSAQFFQKKLPHFVPHFEPNYTIPVFGHMLVGTALGLLLVFRTNASYDRFWEGRRMWGSIINESRNLGRSLTALLSNKPELRDQGLRWTITFAYAAMHRLRDKNDLGPFVDGLPKAEVEAVRRAAHLPTSIARQITETLLTAKKTGEISDYQFVAIDQNVQLLVDYVGACERIHRTPLPFAYVVHLRRALILYCYTLPFALVKDYGWLTVICTLLVTYIFMGIEEIGVEIEDPFGEDDNDLPLERFCQMIQEQLWDLRQRDVTPTSP